MKKLLAAALMLVLASPAFAAIQDVKVSGSITSYFVGRDDFDFDVPGQTNKFSQDFFYTSTHVLISSDLSDNVSAQVGIANEVAWGDLNNADSASGGTSETTTGQDQNVDLELANLTLKSFLYSPLTLTIGRQSLSYGNDFIIGAGGNASVGTMANVANDLSRTQNYDGVRAVLDYKPLTVDLVYVKTNSNNLTGGETLASGTSKDDDDLYGAVANYQLNDPMSTVVEGSFWSQISNGNRSGGTAGANGDKANEVFVPDLRVSTNPIKDLTLGLEGATQFGHIYNASISNPPNDQNAKLSRVWGLQGKASYNLPILEKYKPVIAETVSYYSGDNLKSKDKNNAWQPLYNDQDLGTRIWRSLFAPTNLETSELSLQANPLEDVTTQLVWTDLFLADGLGSGSASYGSIYTANGGLLPDGDVPTTNLQIKDKRNLGNELDGIITYQYTEDVTFGLNLGVFAPGSLFTSKNNGDATEAIASVGVNF